MKFCNRANSFFLNVFGQGDHSVKLVEELLKLGYKAKKSGRKWQLSPLDGFSYQISAAIIKAIESSQLRVSCPLASQQVVLSVSNY